MIYLCSYHIFCSAGHKLRHMKKNQLNEIQFYIRLARDALSKIFLANIFFSLFRFYYISETCVARCVEPGALCQFLSSVRQRVVPNINSPSWMRLVLSILSRRPRRRVYFLVSWHTCRREYTRVPSFRKVLSLSLGGASPEKPESLSFTAFPVSLSVSEYR